MGNVILPMWAEAPAMTRLFCVGYPILSILLMVLASSPVGWLVDVLFVCNLRNMTKFFVWTLFVGPLFSPVSSGMSFLMTLFEIYMAMMYFPSKENEGGSSRLLLWSLLMNGLVNIIYLTVMLGYYIFYSRDMYMSEMYMQQRNTGLWPLVLIILTQRCLSDPQGSTSFWGLAQIPNKWYPICLTAVFCLINGLRVLWNLVAALLIGYTYALARYERGLPSGSLINKWEQRCLGGNGRTCLGAHWVPVTQTGTYHTEARARSNDPGGSELQSSQRQGNRSNFEVFSGSGNRLGEDDLARPLAPEEPIQMVISPSQGTPASPPQQGEPNSEA